MTPATPPDTLSVTPATPPDSVSVTPVRPSAAPAADSVTPCAAVAAASPTAPKSTGNPGISIPSDSVTPATAFFSAAHIRISSRSKTMVPPQLTTHDICRHDRESRVARASRKRVTSLIAPPGSRCCGRVVTHVMPPDWGRNLTCSTLRPSHAVRPACEMRVLSLVFADVWAAEPPMSGARRGQRAAVHCCQPPVELGAAARKVFGDNVLRVGQR